MPLVKQGKFNEYYIKCKEVIEDAERCHNQYFDEYDFYNCGYDPFSEFFYDVDNVYREAVSIKTKLENLLEIAEQKTDASIDKCEKYIIELDEVIYSCIQDFKTVYDMYNGDFTPVEMDTFQNYKIYREI